MVLTAMGTDCEERSLFWKGLCFFTWCISNWWLAPLFLQDCCIRQQYIQSTIQWPFKGWLECHGKGRPNSFAWDISLPDHLLHSTLGWSFAFPSLSTFSYRHGLLCWITFHNACNNLLTWTSWAVEFLSSSPFSRLAPAVALLIPLMLRCIVPYVHSSSSCECHCTKRTCQIRL